MKPDHSQHGIGVSQKNQKHQHYHPPHPTRMPDDLVILSLKALNAGLKIKLTGLPTNPIPDSEDV